MNCKNYEPVEEVHTSCDGCAKFMTTCPADNDVYPRKCWTPKQPEPDAPVKHFSCKGCGKDPCNERRECFYDIGGECNGGLRRYWTPAQLEPHLSCDGCTGREGYECVDCIPDPGDETRKNWTEIQNWMAPWSSSKQTQVMVADPVDGIAAVTERNNKEQK